MKVRGCQELGAKHDRSGCYLRPQFLGTPLVPWRSQAPTGVTVPQTARMASPQLGAPTDAASSSGFGFAAAALTIGAHVGLAVRALSHRPSKLPTHRTKLSPHNPRPYDIVFSAEFGGWPWVLLMMII